MPFRIKDEDKDEDELREEAIELYNTDWAKSAGEYLAHQIPPDGEPWEVMKLCIQELQKENHLTHQQATRLKDQIQQVLNYIYTFLDLDSFLNGFSIRINGIDAQIDTEEGDIFLTTPEGSVHTHVITLEEHHVDITRLDEPPVQEPGSGIPNVKRIKPAYYKKTNPSILTEKLDETAREIESQDKHPLWVKYAVDLHEYVKYNIETKPATPSSGTVQKPRDTLEYQTGDIGSKATLLASLYEAVGIICRITITHDLENKVWRPVLLIKEPEDLPSVTVADKIAEYYTKDTAADPEDLLPLLYTSSDLNNSLSDQWLIADPEAHGIGQPHLTSTSNSNTELTQFIHRDRLEPNTDTEHKISTFLFSLKWVEEHQYINL